MNLVILIGRLTKDPEVRQGDTNIATYTLACDRKFKQEGKPTADFIRCVSYGRSADFVEKYLKKGTKILVRGRMQTGSYTNKDQHTVYTTDVIVEDIEFVESKSKSTSENTSDGFIVAADIPDEELPFM